MHKAQRQVLDFHKALGVFVPGDEQPPQIRDAPLRAALILEEAVETVAAIVGTRRAEEMVRAKADEIVRATTGADGREDLHEGPSLVEAVDGMCDTLFVTYGAAIVFGVDLEPFYDEVHASNMAKVGGKRRADGKILKPEGWKPPRIREMLSALDVDACTCGGIYRLWEK